MRTYTTIDGYANGINDNGQIVGTYAASNGDHGFLYSDGTYTIGPLWTEAAGIDDSGNIVGSSYYYTSSLENGYHGFLLEPNGKYITLDDPLGYSTVALGINEHNGQIVGYFDGSQYPGGVHGFLYSNGQYTTLDDPHGLGVEGTVATGINDYGKIVGYYEDNKTLDVTNGPRGNYHGFLYSNGHYTTLNDPLSPGGTFATGINDHGQIVGYYFDSHWHEHGFLYSNGTYTTINDPLGVNGTEVLGINDYGKIVGVYYDANHVGHGFHT
jgi:probable HAF family extracellular repeat protein